MLKLLIRTYCRERIDKNGNSDLVFIVTPPGLTNQERIKFATGEKCKVGAWSQNDQAVRNKEGQSGAKAINDRLETKKEKLHSLIESARYDLRKESLHSIRESFSEYLSDSRLASGTASNALQTSQAEEFEKFWTKDQKAKFLAMSPNEKNFYLINESIIKAHRKEWSDGYVKRFRTMHTKFFLFDPEFTIDKFSVAWWREFVNFCVEELENSNNTISTDAKVIQKLISELRELGYSLTKGLDEISWKYVEPEIMSVEWGKVLTLAFDIDLAQHEKETYEDSRILWCLGALTGRRWGEIETMDEKNFYQDSKKRWRYRSTAKGLKPVDIPLLPDAVKFLKKINFKFPRRAQQTVNADIKEIARFVKVNGKFIFHSKVLETTIIGKKVTEEFVEEWKTIHIHTGRHSYAMRIVDTSAGMPHYEKFVSFMLGHASHATTWKYLNRRASSHDQMFDEIYKQKKVV